MVSVADAALDSGNKSRNDNWKVEAPNGLNSNLSPRDLFPGSSAAAAEPRKLGTFYSNMPGVYQLSSPSWIAAAASSGVSMPASTFEACSQLSFSRFGVPRERIW